MELPVLYIETGAISRKKYVMVTTKKDGTKTKTYIDPDDPRIAEMGVTKRIRMPASNFTSRLQTSNEVKVTEALHTSKVNTGK